MCFNVSKSKLIVLLLFTGSVVYTSTGRFRIWPARCAPLHVCHYSIPVLGQNQLGQKAIERCMAYLYYT